MLDRLLVEPANLPPASFATFLCNRDRQNTLVFVAERFIPMEDAQTVV